MYLLLLLYQDFSPKTFHLQCCTMLAKSYKKSISAAENLTKLFLIFCKMQFRERSVFFDYLSLIRKTTARTIHVSGVTNN